MFLARSDPALVKFVGGRGGVAMVVIVYCCCLSGLLANPTEITTKQIINSHRNRINVDNSYVDVENFLNLLDQLDDIKDRLGLQMLKIVEDKPEVRGGNVVVSGSGGLVNRPAAGRPNRGDAAAESFDYVVKRLDPLSIGGRFGRRAAANL